MVKTRTKLKLEINKFIAKQENPFKTTDVQEHAKGLTGNIHISPQRLQNYIRANNGVKFNKNLKRWEKVNDRCHEKTEKSIMSI